jgi:hypothetical protein
VVLSLHPTSENGRTLPTFCFAASALASRAFFAYFCGKESLNPGIRKDSHALQAREFILSIPFPACVSIVSNKLGNLLLVQS